VILETKSSKFSQNSSRKNFTTLIMPQKTNQGNIPNIGNILNHLISLLSFLLHSILSPPQPKPDEIQVTFFLSTHEANIIIDPFQIQVFFDYAGKRKGTTIVFEKNGQARIIFSENHNASWKQPYHLPDVLIKVNPNNTLDG
jgi:hypothetical protein